MLFGTHVTGLTPFEGFRTNTGKGRGFGLAACASLGIVVTSDEKDTLVVWDWGKTKGGLRQRCAIGGAGSVAPMVFRFRNGDDSGSGYLAFTSDVHPLLLVTDAGHSAVHIVDVVNRTHEGYVAAPGSIKHPRGVAASSTSPLVAVSAGRFSGSGNGMVALYRCTGGRWDQVWVTLDRRLTCPRGLRFSMDGSTLCVADCSTYRVWMIRVDDGRLVKMCASGMWAPYDVEEVQGGWLVACCSSRTVEFISDQGGRGQRPLVVLGSRLATTPHVFHYPSALAVVPGLGVLVRDFHHTMDGHVHVFATPDMVTMWSRMSDMRVAWMVAVVRGFRRCTSSLP